MNKVSVSVIIPSFNSHKTLSDSVAALYKQTAYGNLKEIILVDSSDDEKSLKQLEEFRNMEKVVVLTSGVRIMPAIQRNLGAMYSSSDLLCFLDSDAYPPEYWIEKIIEAYSSGIRVGGGSYRVPPFQEKSNIARAQYYLQFNEFLDRGKIRTNKLLPSCNLFCERSLFLKVGGFPELRASEDTLFGLTVGKYSGIYFIPNMPVYHIFREEMRSYIKNQLVLGKYIFIYRRFYYNSFYYKGILPYVMFPFFLIMKSIRIIWRIIVAGRRHFFNFMPSLPLFFKGMYYWGKGFLEGVRDYKAEISQFHSRDKYNYSNILSCYDKNIKNRKINIS